MTCTVNTVVQATVVQTRSWSLTSSTCHACTPHAQVNARKQAAAVGMKEGVNAVTVLLLDSFILVGVFHNSVYSLFTLLFLLPPHTVLPCQSGMASCTALLSNLHADSQEANWYPREKVDLAKKKLQGFNPAHLMK